MVCPSASIRRRRRTTTCTPTHCHSASHSLTAASPPLLSSTPRRGVLPLVPPLVFPCQTAGGDRGDAAAAGAGRGAWVSDSGDSVARRVRHSVPASTLSGAAELVVVSLCVSVKVGAAGVRGERRGAGDAREDVRRRLTTSTATSLSPAGHFYSAHCICPSLCCALRCSFSVRLVETSNTALLLSECQQSSGGEEQLTMVDADDEPIAPLPSCTSQRLIQGRISRYYELVHTPPIHRVAASHGQMSALHAGRSFAHSPAPDPLCRPRSGRSSSSCVLCSPRTPTVGTHPSSSTPSRHRTTSLTLPLLCCVRW